MNPGALTVGLWYLGQRCDTFGGSGDPLTTRSHNNCAIMIAFRQA
jgi:hypothetical protein